MEIISDREKKKLTCELKKKLNGLKKQWYI